ncbi:MAG: hypothetical protein RL095_1390 [Verrucomicrobiota bacterium]|jgi:hypothetical protein
MTLSSLSLAAILSIFLSAEDAAPEAVISEPGSIELSSASRELQESFDWAKKRALSLALPPEGQAGPSIASYWAASESPPSPQEKWPRAPGREYFNLRSACHQSLGACILGLELENFTMFRHFALGSKNNPNKPLWPHWSYDYLAQPTPADGGHLALAASFELGEMIHQQFLWSGGRQWIDDAELAEYQDRLHAGFIGQQDINLNGIADDSRWRGSSGPGDEDKFIEAGDSLGCQYQAQIAYGKILAARGDAGKAAFMAKRAKELRDKFNAEWFNPATLSYIRGFDRQGLWKDDTGRGSLFIALKQISDLGPRHLSQLEALLKAEAAGGLSQLDALYLPELLYQNGLNELAWSRLQSLIASRKHSPEIAFVTISNIVAGMMGVAPDASKQQIATLPRLSQRIPWVEIRRLRVGTNEIRLRHDGLTQSSLSNLSGGPLTWQARFPGLHPSLKVNGKARETWIDKIDGLPVSVVSIRLRAGDSATVECPAASWIPLGSLKITAASGLAAVDALPGIPGSALLLSGQFCPEGIGLRDEGAGASLVYSLNRPHCRFVAVLALDAKPDASAVLRILADGREIHRANLKGSDKPLHLDLPLASPEKISLVFSGPGCTLVLGRPRLHLGKAEEEGADAVAQALRDLPPPPAGARSLSLPALPPGFSLSLHESSKQELIDLEGRITPPEDDALVGLVLKVTRDADGSEALSPWLRMVLPAKAPDTAGLVARKLVHPEPAPGQDRLELPKVPEGFALKMLSSSLPELIALDGTIRPPEEDAVSRLIYEIRNLRDGSSAQTQPVAMRVPSRSHIHLSQLKWSSAKAGYGEVILDRNLFGNPIVLAGRKHLRGFGAHAPSELIYRIERKFSRLQASFGVDDGQRNGGSIQFEIYGDGRLLHKTRILRGTPDNSQRSEEIDLDLADVRELTLKVNDGGDGINSDHAVFGTCRLLYPKKP